MGTSPGQSQDSSSRVVATWGLLLGTVRCPRGQWEVQALLPGVPSLSVHPAPELRLGWHFEADPPRVWSSPVELPLAPDSWAQDEEW